MDDIIEKNKSKIKRLELRDLQSSLSDAYILAAKKSKFQIYKEKLRNSVTINPKYIISYKNKTRQRWDVFVLILSVWNSLQIPLDISFTEIEKPQAIKNFD